MPYEYLKLHPEWQYALIVAALLLVAVVFIWQSSKLRRATARENACAAENLARAAEAAHREIEAQKLASEEAACRARAAEADAANRGI